MKILVVGRWVPWPVSTGGRHRLSNIIKGLAALGEVDFFGLTHEGDPTAIIPPPDSGVARARVMARPEGAGSVRRRLLWTTFGKLPSFFFGRDYGSLREDLAKWAQTDYDLVWFNKPETYVAMSSLFSGPMVVDLDDLEDHVALARMSSSEAQERNQAFAWLARPYARKDIRLWTRLQARISEAVDTVVVCSDLDRERLGTRNAVVIPNGYEAPSQPVGRIDVGDPPTIVFPGLLIHPANVDAAQRLATEIAPLIRRQIPDLSVRLVGSPSPSVQRLHDPPRVFVTGQVKDIEVELGKADLIAVPLRYGGGTRIKILEAFAHNIPVVSTSLGAEGLDATDGAHLLLADSAEDFATACEHLLKNAELRGRLSSEARSLYESRYRWDKIRGEVATLGRSVVSGTSGSLHGERGGRRQPARRSGAPSTGDPETKIAP